MTGPSSLRGRLVLTAAAALLVAILVSGAVLWFVLDRFVRGQVDGRLDAQTAALASAVETRSGGEARLANSMDGPPFDRAGSGWYWEYRLGPTILRSRSLADGTVTFAMPPRPEREGDRDRPRPAAATGPDGQALWARIRIADPPGAMIIATAPVGAIHGPLRQALGTVALTLLAVTILLVAAILFQVRLGLEPLRRLEASLADVRAGRRDRVPPKQPAELLNVVGELNALLDQNATGLARARMHVANLAHGLKTPLATLAIALAEPGRDPEGRLAHEIALMDDRVRHHLRRARAAALAGPSRSATALAPCLADLHRAFTRIYAAKEITITVASIAPEISVTCEAEDVDEMLGNLIDNACKWAAAHVWIAATSDGPFVVVSVEDDGPGLGDAETALLPGRRLDESVPGTGFGLAITRELVELYGGRLGLHRSTHGGVRVRLELLRSSMSSQTPAGAPP